MSSRWGIQPRYGEFEIMGAREGKPRLLGEGSFGKTFEAIRKDIVPGGVIETHVALKVLNPSLLGNESRRFQFIQELQALTQFKHANLIHYIRSSEEKGEVFYAMDLCRGGDLDQLVRRYGKLPEKAVAFIALQVAAGLRELHQRHRLVHRDIKPTNVMLADVLPAELEIQHLSLRFEDQDSLCRIVDFGLVDFATDAQEARQGFGGTPMYASPEQICEQPVDGRSDIYSLGMTLWFLLQGKGPLLDSHGREVSKQEAMLRQTRPAEHDADLPSHLSGEFRAILAKMIAKRPERRFANARELHSALRRYIESVETVAGPRFAVSNISRPLDEEYQIIGREVTKSGRKVHLAMQGGVPIRITVVAEPQRQDPAIDLDRLTSRLCEYGELSQESGIPDTLLPVREVLRTSDLIAYTEPSPEGAKLADILRVRARARSAVAFSEAVSILRPIADALDFLLQHQQETVFLPADEIWLSGAQLTAAPKDPAILAKPITEWTNFRVAFSMVCLPRGNDEDGESADASSHHTVTASLQMSESDLHPVPAFARLVYRILNGSEVAAAAQFTPHAYVPAVTLGAASNNLLRDLLCRQRPWINVGTVFRELCANEGIASPRSQSVNPKLNPSSGAAKRSNHPSPIGEGERICEVVRPGLVISPYDRERREQEIPAAQWQPSARVRCHVTRKLFRLPPQLDLLIGRVISPGLVQSPFESSDSPQSVPLDQWEGGGEVVCNASGKRFALPYDVPLPEALRPSKEGSVITPYDGVTRVAIDPDMWEPGFEVACPVAKKNFVLPDALPPLLAIVSADQPGILRTPYDRARTLDLEPKDWVAGATFQCPASGKKLELPPEVERWNATASLVDVSRRLVSNPYRPGEVVEVPAILWKAGGLVRCPGSERSVILPEDLPPLLAEIERPGFVRSPFTGKTFAILPSEWVAGRTLSCPETQRQMVLPVELPEWLPVGSCANLPPGSVSSPFDPSAVVTVPPEQWMSLGLLTCPATKRPFRLPEELPPLLGILKKGKIGSVVSPFSNQPQDVPLENWKPNQKIECAVTKRTFVLPADMEGWIPNGEWVPLSPGRIRCPVKPHCEVQMTAQEWKPRQILVCPETGYRFRAPIDSTFQSLEFERDAVQYALAEPDCSKSEAVSALKARHPAATPDLVQSVWQRHRLGTSWERRNAEQLVEIIPERPGVVRSPYGAHPEIEITPDKWVQGAVVHCPETGRRCRLSGSLPPLIATIAPGSPGSIFSPYAPAEPIKIRPDDWESGRRIACPVTGSPLQMPVLPADWVPEGRIKKDHLGLVLSPYGEHPAVSVSGVKWVGGGRMICPETGRTFLLPAKLPPLIATAVPDHPGLVQTPYAENRTVPVPYRQWAPGSRVICKETKREFLLPDKLPEWNKRPNRWKIPAAIAVVLAVIGSMIGMGVAHRVGSTEKSTPPPSPVPAATTAAAALPAGTPVLSAMLTIEGWPTGKTPRPEVFYDGSACKDVRVEPSTGQGFEVKVPFPSQVRRDGGGTLEVKIPGWIPARQNLTDGKLASPNPLRLVRQKFDRVILKRGSQCDYDRIVVTWDGPLEGEGNVPPPTSLPLIPLTGGKSEIPISLPSGYYKFTMEGTTNTTRSIKPAVLQIGEGKTRMEFSTSLQGKQIYLPPSLAGRYFGLFVTSEKVGAFFLLTIREKIQSLELQEIHEGLRDEYNVADTFLKQPGYVWKASEMTDIVLESPTVLKFACPVRDIETHLEFKGSGSRFVMYIRPDFPVGEAAERAMWNRMVAMLDRQIADAKEDAVNGRRDEYDREYFQFLEDKDFTKEGVPRYKTISTFEAFHKRVAGLKESLDALRSKASRLGLGQREEVANLGMWSTDASPTLYRIGQPGEKPKPDDRDWSLSDSRPKD